MHRSSWLWFCSKRTIRTFNWCEPPFIRLSCSFTFVTVHHGYSCSCSNCYSPQLLQCCYCFDHRYHHNGSPPWAVVVDPSTTTRGHRLFVLVSELLSWYDNDYWHVLLSWQRRSLKILETAPSDFHGSIGALQPLRWPLNGLHSAQKKASQLVVQI